MLQELREARPREPVRAGERCELCTEPIADEHGHLVDVEARRLLCACRGCYLLFTPEGAGGGHYRAVPDRYLAFTDVRLSPDQWDALQIPVSVAFFFVNSTLARVAAFYPSPAGATESLLAARHLGRNSSAPTRRCRRCNPTSRRSWCAPTPTGRPAQSASSCPIDACYELVGHLRRLWRGFDGGREAHDALDGFFDRVQGEGPMTALAFEVLGARPEAHAAVPTIMLRLRIAETTGATVHALALRCQIRIEPQRRRYDAGEEARLYELFGETPQWGESLRPFLWTHVGDHGRCVPGSTEVDLPVECSYDFEVAGAKYLHALGDGDIPLLLLFSGTVFTRGDAGFAAEPVAWDTDASFRLPVAVWRAVMDLYFPNSGWLRVRRDTLDALQRYKAAHALPTWDQALERLLKTAGEDSP